MANTSLTRTPTPNSMHVLENESTVISRPGSLTPSGSRPSSRSGRAPAVNPRPDSAGSRRPHTPTKSVALQAVKRKPQLEEQLEDLKIAPLQNGHIDKSANGDALPVTSVKSSVTTTVRAPETDSDEYDTDLEDGEEEEVQAEEEPVKAPNELFMEFISCLMEQDYKNAQKLLTMILMYEPNHEDALKFKPLIETKLKQEEEAALAAAEEEDDSSEDDSDDEDYSGSSGSSDEDDTDSETSDKEETEVIIASKT